MEDQRKVGESSCNSGDGTDQMVQSLMFMMMMMMTIIALRCSQRFSSYRSVNAFRLGYKNQPVNHASNFKIFAKMPSAKFDQNIVKSLPPKRQNSVLNSHLFPLRGNHKVHSKHFIPFPNLCLVYSLHLLEGRAGTAWETSDQ